MAAPADAPQRDIRHALLPHTNEGTGLGDSREHLIHHSAALILLSYAEDVYCTRKIIRKRHIQRMKDGACSPDIGVYFLDIISSMERIAGYAFTIARYILSQNDEEE